MNIRTIPIYIFLVVVSLFVFSALFLFVSYADGDVDVSGTQEIIENPLDQSNDDESDEKTVESDGGIDSNGKDDEAGIDFRGNETSQRASETGQDSASDMGDIEFTPDFELDNAEISDEGTADTIESAYEYAERLESIDYSLKVISGGVVLTLISAFIWFTLLKPLKGFMFF